VRGLLIVNPQATSTSANVAASVADGLAGLVDLDVAHTRYRGHARELAAAADQDLVIVYGGDGAINEVVNGLMDRRGLADGTAVASPAGSVPALAGSVPALAGSVPAPAGSVPALVAIPGGGGNVFARALGLPASPEATLIRVRELLSAGTYRTIGLALAGDRYFTFSAGLGMDAEVVRDVERQRARGHRESQALYVRTIVRRYYAGTDRRRPALMLEQDGEDPVAGLFMILVTNSAPWTYFRGRPLSPMPEPDFNSGLDVLALNKLKMPVILNAIGQMMCAPVRNRAPRGKHVVTAHGLDSVTIRCTRPTALHVDGEYLGETESVKFQFIPQALRVVAPPA
jgi:diacylglycerol kinase family enzyme